MTRQKKRLLKLAVTLGGLAFFVSMALVFALCGGSGHPRYGDLEKAREIAPDERTRAFASCLSDEVGDKGFAWVGYDGKDDILGYKEARCHRLVPPPKDDVPFFDHGECLISHVSWYQGEHSENQRSVEAALFAEAVCAPGSWPEPKPK